MDYRFIGKLHREYKPLEKPDSLHGIVRSIKNFRSTEGVNFILINGKKTIIGSSSNHDYQIPNINRMMKTGDSISKKADSDTIYLFQNSKRYYFLLDKTINKKSFMNQ